MKGPLIKFVSVLAGLALFLFTYASFIMQVLGAASGVPRTFDSASTYVASAFSGALGTGFAIALGVQPSPYRFRSGANTDWFGVLLTLSLVVYMAVMVVAVLVWLNKPNETPEPLKGPRRSSSATSPRS